MEREKEREKEKEKIHEKTHEKTVQRIDNDPDLITLKNPFTLKNPWRLFSFVLIIVIIVLLIYEGGFTGFTFGKTLSGESAGKKLVDFLNTQGTGDISYVSSKDLGNLYEITVSYDNQLIPIYITKDGKYFVQALVPLDNEALQDIGNSGTGVTAGEIEASSDDDAVLGDKNAEVTIIEFSDYQCPFCEKFWGETLPQLKKEYIDKGKVKLIYRDFPLTDIHPHAQKAAEAAECARKINGESAYWKMHDKLFENQQALSVTDLKKYAKELGLPASFDTCLDSGEMAQEINKDQQDGTSYGVDGTPAFFIDGKPLIGAQPFSAFKQIIDQELNA